MRLLAATRSAGKKREIQRILHSSGIEVVFPDDIGILPSSAEDALEVGESFEANARLKAEFFAKRTGMPTMADDSGLEVFSLGGAPGVRSRRWAGAEGTPLEVDAANNAELLKRLAGAPEVRRRARYRCVLVYLPDMDAVPETFVGACNGRILEQPSGTGGFGYDPLFLSDELNKSFGQATDEEKDAVSHRGRALRALVDALHGGTR